MLSPLDSRLRAIASAGVWAALFSPLFFIPAIWDPFGTGKAWLLQMVVGLTFPAWLALALRLPQFRPPRTLLVAAVLAQVASLVLSLLGAEDWHMAFWGATDRMSGLVTHLHLTAWFVMAVTLLRTPAQWQRALGVMLVVGLLSALGAGLQLVVPDAFGPMFADRVAGFAGNPVFLGGYQVQAFFLAALLGATTPSKSGARRALVLAVAGASLLVVGHTGSRGAVLALALGLGVAGLSWSAFARRWGAAIASTSLLTLCTGGYIALARKALTSPALKGFWERHVSLQHLFEWNDFSVRGRMWRLALEGIAARPVLGWGPCNFETLVARHYEASQGCDFGLLSDPHNLILDVLSSRGAVGLLALLFLWVVVAGVVIRAVRRKHLGASGGAALMGLLAAAPVPHLFNPESPAPLFMAFVTWALVARLEPSPEEPGPAQARAGRRWLPPLLLGCGAVLVLFVDVLPAYASHLSARALGSFRKGDQPATWRELQEAVAIPSPYVEEQLRVGLQLLVALAEQKTVDRFGPWRELLALDRELAQRYFRHHQRTAMRLSWLTTLHKLGLERADHSLLAEAEAGFRELYKAQPHRQEVAYRVGAFLADLGRLDEAETIYRRALAGDSAVGEAHYRYGYFLMKYRRDSPRGSAAIRTGARSECAYLGHTTNEILQVAQSLARFGDAQVLRALVPRVEAGALANRESTYLAFARYLEEVGLIAERDRVLRSGLKHAPAGAGTFKRVLDGQVPRIDDLIKAPEGPPSGPPSDEVR